MSNFLVYSNKLRQWVPALSPEQSEDFVNMAWRDIRESNDQWSFLLRTEYWISPASITLSGVGTTQFSATVALPVTEIAVVGSAGTPPITQRQIRFGLSGGPIYQIASTDVLQVQDGQINATSTTLQCLSSAPFASTDVGKLIVVAGAGAGGQDLQTSIATFVATDTVTLNNAASITVSNATVSWGTSITLDRLYNEQTNTNQTALVYRLYYSPLSTDFQRLDHLVDPITGYEFGWEINPIDDLDRIDPQRSSVTQPYQMFFHHFDTSTALPVFEMWPGPTISRAFTATIWGLGSEFTNDSDALPPQITEELLLTKARMLAYEWGASADPDPMKRKSYYGLAEYVKSMYSAEGQPGRPLGLLDKAIRRDEEVALKQLRMRPRRPGPGWPVDSNFAQSHAIPAWWGGYPT